MSALVGDLAKHDTSRIVDRIGTIYSFEGLLSFKLLTGSTKSFFRESCRLSSVSWSFDILEGINKYNHPVFQESRWNLSERLLSSKLHQYIDDMLPRLGVKDKRNYTCLSSFTQLFLTRAKVLKVG